MQEPSALYESGTWKLWYSGGWATTAIGYASCTSDPTVAGNWTKYASNPVLGQGGSGVAGNARRSNAFRDVDNTLYLYFSDGTDLYVSVANSETSWQTPTKLLSANTPAWAKQYHNSTIWRQGAADYRMLCEINYNVGGVLWAIAYVTASSPLGPWSVQGSGPLTSLFQPAWNTGYSGPNYLGFLNGLHQIAYHVDAGSYSAITNASSADLQTWTPKDVLLTPNFGTYEAQQVADASLVEVAGATYCFYDGVNNTSQSGYINCATYPGTLAQLTLWR